MFNLRGLLVWLIFTAFFIVPAPGFASTYLVGTGMYDITGPAAECGMMGYSMPDQKTEGIHMRLRSRAFVVVDPQSGKRVAFVIAEAGIIPQGVKQAVVKKLLSKYNGLYTDENVTISATHTHSGPGAYSHYALYNLSMLGYDEKHFNTVAEGIYQSIVRAHNNLEPGNIRINMGELNNCGWNRSPLAYEENPAEEKAGYNSNTDKTMTLLRFVATDGSDLGTVNWYAVHPTSMGNTNKLISSDNKGYAAYLFEKQIGTNYAAANTFVAAFAENNAGDVSPNIYWGYPNGVDDYEHMKIIGERQYDKAMELFNEADVNLAGSVDYRHMYVDMSNQYISPAFMPPDQSGAGKTCVAAIGVSMLAGSTEDGKGIDIPEGITYPYDISVLGNPFKWAFTHHSRRPAMSREKTHCAAHGQNQTPGHSADAGSSAGSDFEDRQSCHYRPADGNHHHGRPAASGNGHERFGRTGGLCGDRRAFQCLCRICGDLRGIQPAAL